MCGKYFVLNMKRLLLNTIVWSNCVFSILNKNVKEQLPVVFSSLQSLISVVMVKKAARSSKKLTTPNPEETEVNQF